ncbi:MAG: hypothetical protein KKA54_08860 [Proteobacteria bacterium]|nr:hypothetical protein [Pseudomonadota bacterium]
MKKLHLLLLIAFLSLPLAALAEDDGEKIFIVQQYSYDPGESDGNREIGLSLCGTRCNALSGNFASYLKPGGWRLIRSASNQEVALELDYPFIKGRCICVGDEYRVKWYDPVCTENKP